MTRLHILEHRHVRLDGRASTEFEVVLAGHTPHRLEAAGHNIVRVDRLAPERRRLSGRGVVGEVGEVVEVVVHLGADGPALHVGDFVSVWAWL